MCADSYGVPVRSTLFVINLVLTATLRGGHACHSHFAHEKQAEQLVVLNVEEAAFEPEH